jgi:hypothetical protein
MGSPLHTISRVRVLAHIRKLDDCFGPFLVRVSCLRRFASHRARSPGAPGGLVNDAQGPGATAALLAVREEGRGGCACGEAQAAGHPEGSTLAGEAVHRFGIPEVRAVA